MTIAASAVKRIDVEQGEAGRANVLAAIPKSDGRQMPDAQVDDMAATRLRVTRHMA